MRNSSRSGFADLLGSVTLVVALAGLVLGTTDSSARAAEAAGPGSAVSSDSPEPSAEPAPETPAPPSGGWVPEGEGGAPSDAGGDGPTQGSVLGSGSSPKPTPSPAAEPPPPPPPPESSPSTDYEEPTPASDEQLSSPPSTETAVEPTGATAAKPDSEGSAFVAVSRAVALSSPEPKQAVLGVSAKSALVAAVPATSTDDAGLGTVRLLAIIVCSCILVYAGARLVLGPVEPNWPVRSRYRLRR